MRREKIMRREALINWLIVNNNLSVTLNVRNVKTNGKIHDNITANNNTTFVTSGH
jgi:hypothetical protein